MFLYFCDNFFLFCEKERKNFALTKKNIFHSNFNFTNFWTFKNHIAQGPDTNFRVELDF